MVLAGEGNVDVTQARMVDKHESLLRELLVIQNGQGKRLDDGGLRIEFCKAWALLACSRVPLRGFD